VDWIFEFNALAITNTHLQYRPPTMLRNGHSTVPLTITKFPPNIVLQIDNMSYYPDLSLLYSSYSATSVTNILLSSYNHMSIWKYSFKCIV
ncbi:1912_t:CDS:1, partial [Scutellospora calospora]